jgi:aspartate racemase
MKMIGMLGGMSWESTTVYYQRINRAVQARLGGVHSAKVLIHSVDFGEIAALQSAERWDEAADRLATACAGLARSGADFAMICCNTMHLVSDAIERAAGIPLLHIADPLGAAINARGLRRVGLVGSSYTMERGGVVLDRLRDRYGIDVLVPGDAERAELQRIIFEELCRGRFLDSARATHRAVFEELVARGAEGIVLGCTEIPILIGPDDASVPTFDTTTLHAMAAVEMALE